MQATDQEQHRLECEARFWLKHERHNPKHIKERLEILTKKRHQPQTALAAEMRRQWKQRSTQGG